MEKKGEMVSFDLKNSGFGRVVGGGSDYGR